MNQSSDSGSATATRAASHVKDEVATQGGELKNVAAEHVGALAGQAKEQARNVVSDARSELERQADEQARRLGGALHEAEGQLHSMAEVGDPGVVTDLTRQLADSVGRVSDTIDRGGVQAVAEDLRAFARRQPGLFLVGAGVAGFVAVRLLRAGATSSNGSSSGATPAPGNAAGSYANGGASTPELAARNLPLEGPASPGPGIASDWTAAGTARREYQS